MADLTDAQKIEIVSMLAAFRDVTTILEHFRLVHDLDLTHKQVGSYDPTRSYYEAGDNYRDLFDAKRKAYIEDVATIPIANQGFRLNLLHEQAMQAIKDKKPALAAQLLEQAAKEVGGVLTNQREVKVDDNRRLKPSEMSAEDRKAALAEIIREAMEARAKQPPTNAAGETVQ